jgi:hypothetical protein
MMVLRKKTGWEGLSNDPVMFFEDILNINLTRRQRMILADILHERELRVGMVWDATGEDAVDDAAFLCGVALWRAATLHIPTVLWGGRRSVAVAWMDHMIATLAASSCEFRTDFQSARSSRSSRWGIVMPNGAWALRFDGCFAEDARNACDELGDRADILLGDFAWTDTDSVEAAMDYADRNEAVAMLLISHGCS